ncbi:hypothetical protein [Pseudomonas chlororaphis]|uniref:hypothetical protein n=1 Tax=Pseudomonas chlororaphis TaxID=587753 RepID=UPI0015E040E7|nr:hypothetical protein [Pseudomonas chlororaphis]QLL11372.1 hypothetical protein H0I86_20275 [Pseudomonas chlororaphis subsp. aurantiaca]
MKELNENEVLHASGAGTIKTLEFYLPVFDLGKVTGIMPTLPMKPCPLWDWIGRDNAVAKPAPLPPNFHSFW